ncbi:DUF192 domain-containing protein [Candidatus Lucifugimonas marina]
MKFPIQRARRQTRTILTALVAAASIALIAACATEEVDPALPVLTELGEFIVSDDCADLEHGHLDTMTITVSHGETEHPVTAEIADKPSERAQGLMCRDSIPQGTGMIFLYEEPRTTGFWMLNTYSEIDVLYLDRSRKIVDKITMSPCLRENLNDDNWQVKCATESADYVPRGEYTSVLELPAGWLGSIGVDDTNINQMTLDWQPVAN